MKRYISIFLTALLLSALLTGCGCKHEWEEATCKDPETCEKCGETRGDTGDHSWKKADCTTPKTCKICKKTSGKALGHDLKGNTCSRCEKVLVKIPDLVGQNFSNLPEYPGLVITKKEVYDETVPAGQIISQSLEAGTLQVENTQLKVIVSLGSKNRLIPMPDLIGKNLDLAQTALTENGLNVSIQVEEVYNSNYVAGIIVETVPAQGEKISATATITVRISKGPESIEMPYLQGLFLEDAKTLLQNLGFTSEPVIYYIPSTEPKDTILNQMPRDGQKYSPDIGITLELSDGSMSSVTKDVVLDLKGYALQKSCTVSVIRDGSEVFSDVVSSGIEYLVLPKQEGFGTVNYTVVIDNTHSWIQKEIFTN